VEAYRRDPQKDLVERRWVERQMELRRQLEIERDLFEREKLERLRLLEQEERAHLERDRKRSRRDRDREFDRDYDREPERNPDREPDRDGDSRSRETIYRDKAKTHNFEYHETFNRTASSDFSRNLPYEVVDVLVPNAIIGAVIGRQGANIRDIERVSGAKIRAKPDKDVDKSLPSRPVFVNAAAPSQWIAQRQIYGMVLDLNPVHVNFEVELILPSEQVDFLIGQDGSKLNDVAELSICDLVGPKEDPNKAGKKSFNLSGTFVSVQIAQQMIRDLLVVYGREKK